MCGSLRSTFPTNWPTTWTAVGGIFVTVRASIHTSFRRDACDDS